jgi:hypothetical protein
MELTNKNQLRKGEVGIRKAYSAIRREEKKEQATDEARTRLATQGLLQRTVTTKREIVPPPCRSFSRFSIPKRRMLICFMSYPFHFQ